MNNSKIEYLSTGIVSIRIDLNGGTLRGSITDGTVGFNLIDVCSYLEIPTDTAINEILTENDIGSEADYSVSVTMTGAYRLAFNSSSPRADHFQNMIEVAIMELAEIYIPMQLRRDAAQSRNDRKDVAPT